jgi:predicted phosphodiesterase
MILAISDTHLNGPLAEGNANYYPPQLINWIKKANLVLHAGNLANSDSSAAYNNLLNLCHGFGCELRMADSDEQKITAINMFGIRIGLVHNAFGGYVFSESIAAKTAADRDLDLLVFGHLHEPIIVWNKNTNGKRRLLVCPGPGSNNAINAVPANDTHKCPPYPTVALLQIDNGDISSAEIVPVDWT